jgi:hypothetical protein
VLRSRAAPDYPSIPLRHPKGARPTQSRDLHVHAVAQPDERVLPPLDVLDWWEDPGEEGRTTATGLVGVPRQVVLTTRPSRCCISDIAMHASRSADSTEYEEFTCSERKARTEGNQPWICKLYAWPQTFVVSKRV